ncbi:hypothetical protein [Rhizosphaericola mali]|uniref:Uncharacterized protein n=1 Tax=Rhizosphaericola mali TaxID=2545455 RepID=A0A5P2G2P3_9BACT|nr:hypothetical protein [Rhizosphaericola mali]QES88379.1 hypothetical protein E0W69_006805 [Rhizosphaericola mali]
MKRKKHFHILILLLTLLTFQKSIGELMLHNLEHTSKQSKQKDGKYIQTDCHCFSDFIMPVTFTDEITCIFPMITFLRKYTFTPIYEVIQQKIIASSLRGPPNKLL